MKIILSLSTTFGLASCGDRSPQPSETPPKVESAPQNEAERAPEPRAGETLTDDIAPETLAQTPAAGDAANRPTEPAPQKPASPTLAEILLAHPVYGYELVLDIDKAKQGTSPTAQTMNVWSYKDPLAPKLLATLKISTGAETPATTVSGKSTQRRTKPGYFQMERLFPGRTYVSKTWDAEMPWAMFYDVRGGYAVHATAPSNYHLLGKRASGGCSRLTLEEAKWLLEWVQHVGKGPVLALNPQTGRPQRDKRGQWLVREGYKTLVIITDKARTQEPADLGGVTLARD